MKNFLNRKWLLYAVFCVWFISPPTLLGLILYNLDVNRLVINLITGIITLLNLWYLANLKNFVDWKE
ncbi:MAG: hypothetical protein A3A13_01530 [Candidatus Yanofskybacteria bacterium RIFCSPLOWO2_01_FULL_43_22]|uniref:Uncharacterized protein n=1 Tax=Candidatus Yanofskybacteria bacterium RIFCSPLOWO2_01_FULL_43_22 TaxID=1802695 RepID=A0A1F8GHS5_9BACT|nr:MAG: hypothetical protein A3A13_01530 [Candidatus Yanofskybacteria bacterium RIFCSPLOWO2_01_FULL_43_22]